MAQRPQPAPGAANLTPERMRAAVPILRRRIAELREFDAESVNDRDDPQITVLEAAIDEALVLILGADTLDYRRNREAAELDTARYSMYETPLDEVREGLQHGKERAIALLERMISSFEERLGDIGEDGAGHALRAIEGLDLHPEIERAAGKLYRDGHYANAVEDACKALNAFVKLRSGRDDLDGTSLMLTVFSTKTPILRFNELKDESDRSEQAGMMHLYAGAMMGLRNPRAHKIVRDDAERALEYIAFVSLLAKILDEAERV